MFEINPEEKFVALPHLFFSMRVLVVSPESQNLFLPFPSTMFCDTAYT
jgi:hypothetical protein